MFFRNPQEERLLLSPSAFRGLVCGNRTKKGGDDSEEESFSLFQLRLKTDMSNPFDDEAPASTIDESVWSSIRRDLAQVG